MSSKAKSISRDSPFNNWQQSNIKRWHLADAENQCSEQGARSRVFFNPSWKGNSSLDAAAPPESAGRRRTPGAAAAPPGSAGRRWTPGVADRAGKGRGPRRRWAERGPPRTRERRPGPPAPPARRGCATAGGPASRIFFSWTQIATYKQGCGSGYGWIRINLSCWIRIRIQEGKNYL